MLERLDSVKKVGLFDDYKHSRDCELGEVTLVYGENGVGKSTIAAVLDSLRERNAGEIVRRRTLPGGIDPTVAVTLNGKTYTFDGSDWNDTPPYDTLDVFYPGFVTRNVHAASGVDPEHRRNLCELVLGREAVKNVTRLAEADDEARTALKEIKRLEEDVKQLIKEPDTLEIYLGLSDDPDIDKHLEEAVEELKQAQSKDAIIGRAVPQPVLLPTIDRKSTNELFEKSASGIGENTAAVVKEHINRHLDADGEAWLAYGAKHVAGANACPFCAQNITGSAFVKAVCSYFSAEYVEYSAALSVAIKDVRERLDLPAFLNVRTELISQVAVATQWMSEMAIDQSAIEKDIDEAEEAWRRGVEKLVILIESKQARPLDRIDHANADEAMAEYEYAVDVLSGVNDILSLSKNKAEIRKAALSKAEMTVIEERVSRLKNQKTRYEPLARDIIEKRGVLLAKRTTLDTEKKGLKKAIDERATQVVGKYQESINHYLEYFDCDIRIESVEPKFPGGRASVQYKLKARGHEIQLGLSEDTPCFETVLSDGDKYTLALSFFFARLKYHPNLSGRVVVLDDPVNSLGSLRCNLVERVIRDVSTRGAQVIVLTHDERLAVLMWRDKKLKNIVSLQVERTRSGSCLKPWDVDRATQSEYVGDYITLVDYLENGGDHKKTAGCIRPYVEQRLRYVYPGPPLETRDSLGQMIGKIRNCATGSPLSVVKPKLTELVSINDASLPSHHATDDDAGMTQLSAEEVRSYAEKALDVLK
jgi:wobble nucleotide-excising tRNase